LPLVEVEVQVRAPVERCFDLARSIDLHVVSSSGTSERAVGGVTAGLIGLGQWVTWRARHLGVWFELTSRVTALDRPHHFRDEQVAGPFRHFRHDHLFEPSEDGGTRMRDRLDYRAPLGPLGRLAERLVLDGHLRRFLLARALVIRRAAESDEWRRYLAAEDEPAHSLSAQ
jgi:ligand-binding SRPBCC domain-containing protein